MALHDNRPSFDQDEPRRNDPVLRVTRILLLILVSPALLVTLVLGALITVAGVVGRFVTRLVEAESRPRVRSGIHAAAAAPGGSPRHED